MRHSIIFAISLMFTILAIGAYWYFLSDITKFLETIATIRDQASSAGQREAVLRVQQVFAEETESERAEAELLVMRDSGIVNVIETVEAAGRREKVQVTIGSVVVEPLQGMQHHELVRLTMSARGTFPSLGAFTTALETFPVMSKLDSIALEASSNNLWFGTYTLLLIKEKTP